MNKFVKLSTSILWSFFILASLAHAATPSYLEKHKSSPEDIQAINQVISNFQTAIKNKNPKLLSTLILNSHILFTSPWPEEDIKQVQNESNITFDGIKSGGYDAFATLLKTEKSTIEEKFYDVNITQDDNLAWVMFNFEFIREDIILNHGVEVWQLMKVGQGNWKILSVVWSSKGKPPQ